MIGRNGTADPGVRQEEPDLHRLSPQDVQRERVTLAVDLLDLYQKDLPRNAFRKLRGVTAKALDSLALLLLVQAQP